MSKYFDFESMKGKLVKAPVPTMYSNMSFSEEDLELILRALVHYGPAIATDKAVQDRIGEAYEDEDGNVAVEEWMIQDELVRAGGIAKSILSLWGRPAR